MGIGHGRGSGVGRQYWQLGLRAHDMRATGVPSRARVIPSMRAVRGAVAEPARHPFAEVIH
ncbi:hypothetical protein B8W90_14180, partial [Staphylococcus hominis]